MGIVVTLRKNTLNTSYYKEILLSLMDSGLVDNMLVSSGFFTEYESYGVSKELNREGNSMISCLKKHRLTAVTVIGVYGQDDGLIAFIKAIKKACKNVIGYCHKDKKWHAKICILRNGERALAGIIGSTNLTLASYSHSDNSSYESDAFIFSNDNAVVKVVTEKVAKLRNADNNSSECVLLADYDPQKNSDLTEEDVLNRYYATIVNDIENHSVFEKIEIGQ